MDLNKESARLAKLKLSERRALQEGAELGEPMENKVVMGKGSMKPVGGSKRRGRPRKSAPKEEPKEAHGLGKHKKAPKKESKKGEKEKAMKLGEAYGKAIHDEDDEVKALVGSGFFSDFADGFKKGFKSVVSPALKVASVLPIPEAQVASAVGQAVGLGKHKKEKKAPKKRQASAKMKKRGALVSKLMKSKGMSLGQASKYIKENNLL